MHDEPASREAPEPPRRGFLRLMAIVTMWVGLVAGYGAFLTTAIRYLFPAPRRGQWLYVARAAEIRPGDSLTFESPDGVDVVIKRSAGPSAARSAEASEFVALSSTCPHLGCRVHWEGQHNRFFCPCHNGQFDPEGNPTGGPPLAAGQKLPRYPLKVEGGLLFIEMAPAAVGGGKPIPVPADDPDHAPHHRSRSRQVEV